MKIIPFTYCESIELYANTYILIDDNDDCVVIDPGKDYPGIVDFIKQSDLHLRGILLTHGHFDHIRGVKLLSDEFNVFTYLNAEDEKFLKDTHYNASDRFSLKKIVIDAPQIFIKDGEILHLLKEPIEVIATPYHTGGSVCFYLKDSKVIFTGDSLFAGGFGRTDFPGARPDLFNSSMKKLFSLPGNVEVYPGHGEKTTIEIERNANTFVKI